MSVDAMDAFLTVLVRGPDGMTDDRFEFTIQSQFNNSRIYGYYDPPTATRPGRVKATGSPGTNFSVPYFETTEAFDNLVADALRAEEEPDASQASEPQPKLAPETPSTDIEVAGLAVDGDTTDLWRWATIGLTGLVVVMLTAGGGVTFARRRREDTS